MFFLLDADNVVSNGQSLSCEIQSQAEGEVRGHHDAEIAESERIACQWLHLNIRPPLAADQQLLQIISGFCA